METSVTGASSSTADSMGMTVSGLPNVFFASRFEACKTVNFPLCLPDEIPFRFNLIFLLWMLVLTILMMNSFVPLSKAAVANSSLCPVTAFCSSSGAIRLFQHCARIIVVHSS